VSTLHLGLETLDGEKAVFRSRFHGMGSDQVDEEHRFPVDCYVTLPRHVWANSGRPLLVNVELSD
jgi:hypothetical protein